MLNTVMEYRRKHKIGRKKQKDEVFSRYPCSVFLHNALRFISQNKSGVAYEEICHAIIRSGGELTEEEMRIFVQLKLKGGADNG